MSFQWARSGYCCMCGDCCNKHNFHGPDTAWVDNPDVPSDPEGYCKFFDREMRKCQIQKAKPIGCVLFPSTPFEILGFPNCTYRFEKVFVYDRKKDHKKSD
jgi:hypothetical protein